MKDRQVHLTNHLVDVHSRELLPVQLAVPAFEKTTAVVPEVSGRVNEQGFGQQLLLLLLLHD